MTSLKVSAEEEKRVKAQGFLRNRGTDCFSARIITHNGKITAAQTKCIAEAAEKFGNGTVTMTGRMTIEVPGVAYESISAFQEFISKAGLVTGGTGAKVRPVVSCKGTTCRYGLIDTFALSEEIHQKFYEGYGDVKLPHKFKIAVGGCPNNCVKPNLNDVGIIGQRVPRLKADLCRNCKKCSVSAACPVNAAVIENEKIRIDRQKCLNCGLCTNRCPFGAVEPGLNGYKIYIGGRWGKNISHGIPLPKVFSSKDEALDVLERAMFFYRDNGQPGERFAQTIERIGFHEVSDALLNKK